MSENIQSISQGNYILATQQEVSHDNTLSGDGTTASPLGVVPGYNETVLWTNSNPGQISANVTLTGTLTESCSTFETIRFVCKGSCDTNETWVCPFQFQDFSYNTANASNQGGIYLPIRIGSTIYRDSCMITMNDNTFTANNGSRVQGLTSMSENTSRGPYILKVVGINRKQ